MARIARSPFWPMVAIAAVQLGTAHATAAQCEEWTLTAVTDQQESEFFGRAVALDGAWAVVGVPNDDMVAGNAGSARVLQRAGTGWKEVATLTADDGTNNDAFGSAVSISGRSILVGSPGSGNSTGAAYVFRHVVSGWVQVARIAASDGQSGDRFGNAVSIDGTFALVGAPLDNAVPSPSDVGSAYIFRYDGTSWTQQQKVDAGLEAEADAQFGASAFLSGDDAIIGAPFKDGIALTDVGAAYVFRLVSDQWIQQATLAPSGALLTSHRFGWAVSLDGDTAIVGAPEPSPNPNQRAYVFVRSGSFWNLEATLEGTGMLSGDGFGTAVSISGNLAAVGASNHPADGVQQFGAAFVFERNGSTWTEQSTLLACDMATGSLFGSTLALKGGTLLTGAFGHDTPAVNAGAAYTFEFDGAAWAGTAKLLASGHISVSAGGSQTFFVEAGSSFAGQLYLLLGTNSGNTPGFSWNGVHVPLNIDPYLRDSFLSPNTLPLTDSFGFLDANGSNVAQYAVPAGSSPSLAGLSFHHAYLILDATTLDVLGASNAQPLTLLP